jgi:hypothetical protein
VRRLLEERLRQSDLELTVSLESHQLATVGALVAARALYETAMKIARSAGQH